MYDSFDNMYQATIGIDFLSKVQPLVFPYPSSPCLLKDLRSKAKPSPLRGNP